LVPTVLHYELSPLSLLTVHQLGTVLACSWKQQKQHNERGSSRRSFHADTTPRYDARPFTTGDLVSESNMRLTRRSPVPRPLPGAAAKTKEPNTKCTQSTH
jgi:hypothetical protein